MERLQKKINKLLNNKTLNTLQCQSFMVEKYNKMSIIMTVIITIRRKWKFSLQHTRTRSILDYMTLCLILPTWTPAWSPRTGSSYWSSGNTTVRNAHNKPSALDSTEQRLNKIRNRKEMLSTTDTVFLLLEWESNTNDNLLKGAKF